MEISEAEKDAFLRDLESVFMKHQIGIVGCGCCGSPWIGRLEANEIPVRLIVNKDRGGGWSDLKFQPQQAGDGAEEE